MVAHDKELGVFPPHRTPVKFQSSSIEPLRAFLFVILKGKPQILEFLYLFAIAILPQIDDVRDSLLSKLLNITPGSNCATEG